MSTMKLLAALTAAGLMLAPPPAVAAEEVTIGTGSSGGPYYAFARQICKLINRKTDAVKCSVLATPKGDAAESFANLVNVRNGTVDVAMARSDWQHFAVTGTGPVKHLSENFQSLRSLFSIHSQPFTLVARRDSGIASVDDLKGKRINLGKPYSDDRTSMDLVLGAKALSKKDFVLVEELPADQQSLAFCHNRVQAIYYVVSHPNEAVRRVTSVCDGRLVNVAGPAIDKLVAGKPYLAHTTIPVSLYGGTGDPVKTFGAPVTLVSSTDVSADTVYALVKAIFENLGDMKKLHPALGGLDPARMSREGLTAPLHDGAERYFREQGLM